MSKDKSEVEVKLGDVVYSKAGRDANRHYIVMWINSPYIGICDGDLHKTDKIKKKKVKHVKSMEYNSSYIHNKLSAGEKVTSSEIRRALDEYRAEQTGPEHEEG